MDYTAIIEKRFSNALGAEPELYEEMQAASPYEVGALEPETLERLIKALWGERPYGKLCAMLGRSHGEIARWKRLGLRKKVLRQFLDLYPDALEAKACELIWAKNYLAYDGDIRDE